MFKLKRSKTNKYFVYILTSYSGVLYVGLTNHLINRITEHRLKLIPGFTSKYNVNRLIYFEEFDNSLIAAKREKQLKSWNRTKKINLIKLKNPEMKKLL